MRSQTCLVKRLTPSSLSFVQFVQPAAVGYKVPGALPNLPGTFLDVSMHGGKNDPVVHTETRPVIQNNTLVKSFIVSVPSTKNADVPAASGTTVAMVISCMPAIQNTDQRNCQYFRHSGWCSSCELLSIAFFGRNYHYLVRPGVIFKATGKWRFQ